VQSLRSKTDNELKVWEKVRIIVGEGREAGVYEARVEDFINGGVIINEPEFVSGHSLLRNGLPVQVQVTREDAAYQFSSQIRVQSSGRTKKYILSPPKRFSRIQRRMFSRVDLLVNLKFAPLVFGIDWSDADQELAWEDLRGSNISGGGILLKVPEKVFKDSLVIMQIDLLAEADLSKTVIACCRRTFVSEGSHFGGYEFVLNDDLHHHLSGAEIKAIPVELRNFCQASQDRLVTFLFHKQIEFRQRGLI
jgi:c-di-GMP-binding flagellar brake protein YcgR